MQTNEPKPIFQGLCTKKEIAKFLKISERTLYRKLKKAKIITGPELLTPNKVRQILEQLGC